MISGHALPRADEMKIDTYRFGKIVIDGKDFGSDLLVVSGRVDDSWWRKEGHALQVEDLNAVLAAQPKVLVVGTGYFGMMKVPVETMEVLESKGIEVVAARTSKAVEAFNRLADSGMEIAAAFHLTC